MGPVVDELHNLNNNHREEEEEVIMQKNGVEDLNSKSNPALKNAHG